MNVGIVGLGHLGKIHLKLINEISAFNLSALYDIDKEVMANLPYQNNVTLCSSYNELLELSDAVVIVTPTSSHFDLASSAIKKGKHVFIGAWVFIPNWIRGRPQNKRDFLYTR